MKSLITLALIIISINLYSQNPNLVTDFKQTTVFVTKKFQRCNNDRKLGNCVSIAVIKCALAQFGSIDSLYKTFITNSDGSFDITFYDDLKIHINKEEIEIVQNISGIKPNENSVFFNDALIIYASMCKRIYEKRNQLNSKCISDFTNAVEYLNSGYVTINGNDLLGMDKIEIELTQISNEPHAIIWCSAHAAFVSNGIQDLSGNSVPLIDNEMRNLSRYSKIKGGYKLKKP